MDRYVNVNGLAEYLGYLGVSRMTVYNMLKINQLPQGERFTRRSIRWNLDDVREFLKSSKK